MTVRDHLGREVRTDLALTDDLLVWLAHVGRGTDDDALATLGAAADRILGQRAQAALAEMAQANEDERYRLARQRRAEKPAPGSHQDGWFVGARAALLWVAGEADPPSVLPPKEASS